MNENNKMTNKSTNPFMPSYVMVAAIVASILSIQYLYSEFIRKISIIHDEVRLDEFLNQ